jgi:hypothetical protein
MGFSVHMRDKNTILSATKMKIHKKGYLWHQSTLGPKSEIQLNWISPSIRSHLRTPCVFLFSIGFTLESASHSARAELLDESYHSILSWQNKHISAWPSQILYPMNRAWGVHRCPDWFIRFYDSNTKAWKPYKCVSSSLSIPLLGGY